MSSEVLEEVRQTVAEVFALDADAVTAETSAETLPAWDSMGHLNLILATEQRFGVMFDPEEVPKLISVQALADAIAAQQK
jgi:acyl carrier protein